MTPIETVLEAIDGARKSGAGWSAKCPAHEDRAPSLSVSEGDDGRVLLFCHAGCSFASIVRAAGLEEGDLFPPKDGDGKRVVAEYAYTDEKGAELFRAVRFEPKNFRQKRREGDTWTWNLNGTRRVLYRLPDLLEGVKAGATVYVAEGEKDVAALRSLGLVATCNPMGAGKWRDEYAEALKGARVVVVADKDEPGRKHAAAVAASLSGKAASVVVAEVAEGKDAAEWIAQGATRADFEALDVTGPEEAEVPARVVSLDSLLAEPEEPIAWLVEEILSERGLAMLAAEAYMTKSTLAGCLALHLAAGRDFLGWKILRPRPVLYWQTEGSVGRFKKRLAVAAAYYGIETKGLPLFLERTGIGEDFRTPAFREIAERVRGGLVIADTSGSFYFGDENSAEEVRAGWVRPLKTVAAACDVAVLTVHHHGKPSKERDGHHRGRGSSALFGDFDTWLRIEKVPAEPTHRALYVDKVREADAPPALELAFLGDRAAFDVVTGEGISDVKVDAKAERAAAKAEAERKAAEDVARLLRQTPEGLTAEEIRESLGRRRDWIAAVLGDLHARGHVGRESAERVNARDQRIRVGVWKYLTEAAA